MHSLPGGDLRQAGSGNRRRIAPEDANAFAVVVASVLRDEDLRARLSAAGPEDARAWSHEVLVQRMLAVYRLPRQAPRPPELAEESV